MRRDAGELRRQSHGAGLDARLVWPLAGVVALIVGIVMAGGAAMLGLSPVDVFLVALLGGAGAGAYVRLFGAAHFAKDS